MDKKLSIVLAIAVAFIIVGGYLVFTNQPHGDVSGDSFKIPLKTQDFKLFEMNIPEGSNFSVKNEADGMKFYQNTGNYSGNLSGFIINRNLTDSLIGINSQPISNSSSENIYVSEFKNETVYRYVSNQGEVDFILIGNDLNLLKEVSDTIKIKDLNNL